MTNNWHYDHELTKTLCPQAAAEVERLRAEVAALRAAVPVELDPTTNNGDWRNDAEWRMGWNECRRRMIERMPAPTVNESLTFADDCGLGLDCDDTGVCRAEAEGLPEQCGKLLEEE